MLYDVETRSLIARERVATLRADAALSGADHPARRWLAARLIAAGRRLEPDCRPHPVVRVS
jgi:hypothetical protein